MEVRPRGSSLNRFQYSDSKVVVVMLGLLLQIYRIKFDKIRAEPLDIPCEQWGISRANRFVDNAVAYRLGGHRVGATNH